MWGWAICLIYIVVVMVMAEYIGEFEIVDDHRGGKIVIEVSKIGRRRCSGNAVNEWI